MFKFKNVGKEIKMWAKIGAYLIFIPYCIIAAVLLIGGLIAMFVGFEESVLVGVLSLIGCAIGAAIIGGLGYLLARLSAVMMVGYGELIEKTSGNYDRLTAIEAKLTAPKKPAPAPAPVAPAAPAEAPVEAPAEAPVETIDAAE